MFHHGLNAGFGDPLPTDRLEAMKARGVTLVRTSLHQPMQRGAVTAQIAHSGLQPLYILTGGADEIAYIPDGSWVSLGNEPNLGDLALGLPSQSPRQYADFFAETRELCRARRLRTGVGVLSSIDPTSMNWLSELLVLWPDVDFIDQHRYPFKEDQDPDRSPYGTREQEMAAFYAVIGERRFLISECGNRTAQWRDWWPPPFQHHVVTEQDRLALAIRERDFWQAQPHCDGIVWYQEAQGPDGTDHYGFRAANWEWLPVADVLA